MQNRNIELSVGILGIVGLLAIAGVVLQFGKLGGKFRKTYELIVEISDATGIRKGVPVRLGGVSIGFVNDLPNLKEDFSGMELPLSIFDDVKIPRNSTVSIGTTGLMGDSYVKITLPRKLTGEFVEADSSLPVVTSSTGLTALQSDAESLLNGMSVTLTEINRTIKNLDRTFEKIDFLTSAENMQTLNDTVNNIAQSSAKVNKASDNLSPLMTSLDGSLKDFSQTSQNLRELSVRLDPVITSAGNTFSEMEQAAVATRTTIQSADVDLNSGIKSINQLAATIAKAEPGIEQLEGALVRIQTGMGTVEDFVVDLDDSEGILRELRDNPKFKSDLIDLITKLESKGFVFYPREKPIRSSQGQMSKFVSPKMTAH